MVNQFPGNALAAINSAQQVINNSSQAITQAQSLIVGGYSADQNGLPYTKVPDNKQGVLNRNIITWFVPQFGTVRMFINPANITYNRKKLINPERTKGGYVLQYWGEALTTINISGTTGTSGIEGINVLEQVYIAEQYAFDAIGLTLAGNNASTDLSNNLVNGAGAALGNSINQLFGGSPNSPNASAAGGVIGGILGLDSPGNNLAPQNIPSLASLAFTVEMFYNGWIYRGFFDSMNVIERCDNFLVEYNMVFMATQRTGYRVNQFPWQTSAKNGPSGPNTPYSFSGNV